MDPASIVARIIIGEPQHDLRGERNRNMQGRVVLHISSGPSMRRELRELFEVHQLYSQIANELANLSVHSIVDREEFASLNPISSIYRRNICSHCPSKRKGDRN